MTTQTTQQQDLIAFLQSATQEAARRPEPTDRFLYGYRDSGNHWRTCEQFEEIPVGDLSCGAEGTYLVIYAEGQVEILPLR